MSINYHLNSIHLKNYLFKYMYVSAFKYIYFVISSIVLLVWIIKKKIRIKTNHFENCCYFDGCCVILSTVASGIINIPSLLNKLPYLHFQLTQFFI